jgi:hypothetical protein
LIATYAITTRKPRKLRRLYDRRLELMGQLTREFVLAPQRTKRRAKN